MDHTNTAGVFMSKQTLGPGTKEACGRHCWLPGQHPCLFHHSSSLLREPWFCSGIELICALCVWSHIKGKIWINLCHSGSSHLFYQWCVLFKHSFFFFFFLPVGIIMWDYYWIFLHLLPPAYILLMLFFQVAAMKGTPNRITENSTWKSNSIEPPNPPGPYLPYSGLLTV